VAAGGAASRLGLAIWLAALVPAALLAGAWGSQIWGGLHPCEMCWWQRYAHLFALAFALCALLGRLAGLDRHGLVRPLLWFAALAMLASGGIGAYQTGVEAHVLQGPAQCTGTAIKGTPAELIEQIMNASIVSCDVVQWRFLAISMAGWNAILSIGFALWILWLSLRRPRARR
jgi:disulfide bond formation protein DsbB